MMLYENKKETHILSHLIYELGLSKIETGRLYNCIIRNGLELHTVEDLKDLKWKDVRKWKNMGPKTFEYFELLQKKIQEELSE